MHVSCVLTYFTCAPYRLTFLRSDIIYCAFSRSNHSQMHCIKLHRLTEVHHSQNNVTFSGKCLNSTHPDTSRSHEVQILWHWGESFIRSSECLSVCLLSTEGEHESEMEPTQITSSVRKDIHATLQRSFHLDKKKNRKNLSHKGLFLSLYPFTNICCFLYRFFFFVEI